MFFLTVICSFFVIELLYILLYYLVWLKLIQKKKFTFSRIRILNNLSIVFTILGLFYTLFKIDGFFHQIEIIEDIGDLNGFSIIAAFITFFGLFWIFTGFLIEEKIELFLNKTVGGHIKAFFDTNLSLLNRNITSFSDNVIHKTGYLKIRKLISDYKEYKNGMIKILNKDHFFEIWDVFFEDKKNIKSIEIIEYLPQEINSLFYSGAKKLYEDLIILSEDFQNKKNHKIERYVITKNSNCWNEDLGSSLFAFLPYKSENYKLELGIKEQNFTEFIYFLIHFQNKYYFIQLQNSIFYQSDNLLEKENYLQLRDNSAYLELRKKFDNHKISDTTPDVNRLNVFSKVLRDKIDIKNFYELYIKVYESWVINATNDWGDIYGVDTSMLNNDIQDWLNKAFYKRILDDNGEILLKMKEKNSIHSIKRIFVLSEKLRNNKVSVVSEILQAHINKHIQIGIIDIKWLENKLKSDQEYINSFKDLRDFNLMINFSSKNDKDEIIGTGLAYEICGLRRIYNGNFENLYIDAKTVPSYPFWDNYIKFKKPEDQEQLKKKNEFVIIKKQYELLSQLAIWFKQPKVDLSEDIEISTDSLYEKGSKRHSEITRYQNEKISLEKLLNIIKAEELSFTDQKEKFYTYESS